MAHRNISRRDFLATSAFGLVGLGIRGRFAVGGEWLAEHELLYVGTYTENGRKDGIVLVQFDRRTGALRQVGAVDAGPNPSFLAIHPNGHTLYAVNELDKDGDVSAFSIEAATGALRRVAVQKSQGGAPCYVSIDRSGRVVLVANYATGTVALFPIGKGGAIGAAAFVDQHHGTGPVTDRQEGPHAHCIVADPSNRFVLSTDLGADRVLVYGLDARRGELHRVESSDAVLRAGSGPRHIAFHPTKAIVYVVSELASTLSTFEFDRSTGKLTMVDSRSTLPDGWKGTSWAADIHVTPNGAALYTSNRGHNSVAHFSLSHSGLATLDETVSCGGDWPRNFSLDPSGRWIVVANQRSGTIDVLSRDRASGRLTPTSQRLAVPAPSCVRFRASVGVTT